MKLKIIFSITSAILLSNGILAQKIKPSQLSFEQMDSLSIEYFKHKQFDSAISIIELAQSRYTDREEQTSGILGYLYTKTNKFEKALKIWENGISKGYFYGLQQNGYYNNIYQENKVYKTLLIPDKQNGDSLTALSHLKYKVVLPPNYNPGLSYPVCFVFHGNGRNIEVAKDNWKSEVYNNKLIMVYLQSYIHQSRYFFRWESNDQKIRSEFKVIYDSITTSYPIDKDQIIFTGMSAGGRTVLEFAFNDFVPITSIILNCPVIPDNISNEKINAFASKGKKLAIITGDKDWAFNDQKELIQKIEVSGSKCKFIVNYGRKHEFTEKFQVQFDECLGWQLMDK